MKKDTLHLLRIASLFDGNDEARHDKLFEILKAYPTGIKEIAFFTNNVHSPFTLKEAERRAEKLKEYIKKAKSEGYRAGINHLTTIGHHEEDLDYTLGDKYTYMTGVSGKTCHGSYCMNDDNFINEYVIPLYKMLAKTEPEFILVDDDIRYGHMPIGYGCFCDKCIEKFNKKNGFNFTRETLIEKLNSDDVELRKLWLIKQSEAIENILYLIGKAVRSVNENITLGFMTGERYFEGYRFDKWAEALSDGGKYEIMWRPGGGAYTDYRFDEIVEKSEQTGRQNAYLPSYVTEIQYEIENFPYQVVKKTPTSTAIEAAWSMTSGCTGAAFNILPWESSEDLDVITPHIKAINKLLPLYNILKEKTAGKMPFGITTPWKQFSQASLPEGNFINGGGDTFANFAKEVFDLGFPQAYHRDNSVLTLLKGEFGKCHSDEELIDILSCGVYSDVSSIEYLNSRGFNNLTGFKKGEDILVDAIERYLPHEFNEGIEQRVRNCRQAFNFGDSFSLIATDDKAVKVAELVDYHKNVTAECSLGLFENEKEGRVAVASYYPYTWISDSNKFSELKKLFRYLSKNQLPSYVESFLRIRNHSFVSENKIIVSLLNPTNENYFEVKVAVKGDKEKAKIFNQSGNSYIKERESFDGEYSLFNLDSLPSYEIALIEA